MALFEPEFGLIFWMLVVFLALFGILAKYAWPVIIRSVEERAAYIDKGVASAREAIELKKQAEYDAQTLLTDAQRKQLEILSGRLKNLQLPRRRKFWTLPVWLPSKRKRRLKYRCAGRSGNYRWKSPGK